MSDLPKTMQAAVLHRHGGPEAIEVRHDWPRPEPAADEVLIEIAAAGINNTDINTRIGWYSKAVEGATDAEINPDTDDASWSGTPLSFPRIQGADACGRIVEVGKDVDPSRIGERVLVRPMQSLGADDAGVRLITFGSECDGGFANYARVAARQALEIDSELSNVELASFPCAASTAEGLLSRLKVREGEDVLVTGASGGVGSMAVQLAVARGARVTAVASAQKADFVRNLGAADVLDRTDTPPESAFDAIADVVGGDAFEPLLAALRRGGRYGTSGAIAGPLVTLDLRTLYLKDLTLVGSTHQEDAVMERVVTAIESVSLRPVVSKTYPLSAIHEAQQDFMTKRYPGKLVLIPDRLT